MTATVTGQTRAYVRVAGTDGDGAFLRRTPRLDDRIVVWRDGTTLEDLGGRAEGDGLSWRRVRDPEGNIGWMPDRYLVPGGQAVAAASPRAVAATPAPSGSAWRLLSGELAPGFHRPGAVAVAADASLFVLDSGNARVVKLSPSGQLLSSWGSPGRGTNQFGTPTAKSLTDGPQGIALDRSGNVYVADTWNHRILKFTPTGQPVARWGTLGKGPGQFDGPTGIALDGQGNMYVADEFNHRVQKLSPAGDVLAIWGGEGSAAGRLGSPYGVALDDAGNLYVTERGNSRVQKFGPDGRSLAIWGSFGRGPGQFHGPAGIAVDKQGRIYVAEAGTWGGNYESNSRVQVLEPSGDTVGLFGSEGNAHGQFFIPIGVAIDRQGDLLVVERVNNRVQRLSPAGRPLGVVGSFLSSPSDLATDPEGNLYVVQDTAPRILRLSPTGAVLARWGTSGEGSAEFTSRPVHLAVAPNGDVFAADHRVQRFSASGEFLGSWSKGGSPTGSVGGIAVDGAGDVLVAEGATIRRFRHDGQPVQVTSLPSGPGGPPDLGRLVVARDGSAFVADVKHHRILHVAPDGRVVAQWGRMGGGPGEFTYPGDLALDAQGNLWVVDFANDRVQRFAPDGRHLGQWGQTGTGPGEFKEARGIAVDTRGNVYVADGGTRRIQVADGLAAR